jgi:hypothetical protein
MEVIAATFRRTSESRQVHSLAGPGHRAGPFPVHPLAFIEPLAPAGTHPKPQAVMRATVAS